MYVQYSFLDNRYRTMLLSFHLNRNLISKVASRFLLFTLFCITYLHWGEMNPIGFLFQFFIPYQMPHNLKCINFKCALLSLLYYLLSAGVSYKTDLIQTIKNSTALQLSGIQLISIGMEWDVTCFKLIGNKTMSVIKTKTLWCQIKRSILRIIKKNS